MSKTCGECENYIGFGDWNLCCKEEHDPKEFPFGHLCYEDTLACDKFKPISETKGCSGCVYEDADGSTPAISNCICCSRNVDYAKNDYYKRKRQ